MKTMLISISFGLAMTYYASAQETTYNDKSLGQFGPIKLGALTVTDMKNGTEYTSIHGDFQNAKYSRIVDLGGFLLPDSLNAAKFCNDLEEAIPLVGAEGSMNLWSGELYRIRTSGAIKEVVILTKDGTKHCYLSPVKATEMIKAIRTNLGLIKPLH